MCRATRARCSTGCGSATSSRCRRARSRRAIPATSPIRSKPAAPGNTGRTRPAAPTWSRITRSITSTSRGGRDLDRHSGARAKPANPESSATSGDEYGFRVRPLRGRPGMTEEKCSRGKPMNRLKLTIATTDYDHFRDFRTGAVRAEGIDHIWLTLGHHEIFSRFTFNREWDVTELSFAKFSAQVTRPDPDIIGLPVFASRLFRFGSFYVNRKSGIKTAADLKGKSIEPNRNRREANTGRPMMSGSG